MKSYDIVTSIEEAQVYPSVPKLYIEDTFDECEPYDVYKIIASLCKLESCGEKGKKKIKNLTVVFVENVKIMIFDFYYKQTALLVGKFVQELHLSKADRILLPLSL